MCVVRSDTGLARVLAGLRAAVSCAALSAVSPTALDYDCTGTDILVLQSYYETTVLEYDCSYSEYDCTGTSTVQ